MGSDRTTNAERNGLAHVDNALRGSNTSNWNDYSRRRVGRQEKRVIQQTHGCSVDLCLYELQSKASAVGRPGKRELDGTGLILRLDGPGALGWRDELPLAFSTYRAIAGNGQRELRIP